MFKQIREYVSILDQEPMTNQTFFRFLLPLNLALPHIVEFVLLIKMWFNRKKYKRDKRLTKYYSSIIYIILSWYLSLWLRGSFITHVTTMYIFLHLYEALISIMMSILLFFIIKKWLDAGMNYTVASNGGYDE